MATLDDEVDGLYRLPASEFTAARNALAKNAGRRAAEVKGLAKPSAPAWAVNQLYWRHRPVFDALVKASEAIRAAHVRQLAGEKVNLEAADLRHHAALASALEVAREYLTASGDTPSAATITAVTRTLEAVPSPDIRGRLERPIERVGFSMLADYVASEGIRISERSPAQVVVMKRRRAADEGTAAGRAQSQDSENGESRGSTRPAAAVRQRERDRLKKTLTEAQAREREAARALARLERQVERTREEVETLEASLEHRRHVLADQEREIDGVRRAADGARTARADVERRLREVD